MRLAWAVILSVVLWAQSFAIGHCEDTQHLLTNERYVEDVLNSTALPLDHPPAMFAYVLNSLPGRVKVFPTENYYYFQFITNGLGYSGNIRLDAKDRDHGKLHFTYFEDFSRWKQHPTVTHVILDQADGVMVEKLEPLRYRVSCCGKTVEFELNDLSDVAPPASSLRSAERYIGPVFDDSAIQFFLIFNDEFKIFLYVLDETVTVADKFVPAKHTTHILIGKRTGFAFYQDKFLNRKILIGVFADNASENNHFDGPFDQLPDNFLRGDTLRQSIIRADPKVAGAIDRFGNFLDGSGRYLIAPYFYYRSEEDLRMIDKCAKTAQRKMSGRYYSCFSSAQNRRRF